MSPRSRAEQEAIADEEAALEETIHASLLGNSELFEEASARVRDARARAANARRDRSALGGDTPDQRVRETDVHEDDFRAKNAADSVPLDRELEDLFREDEAVMECAEPFTFERDLVGQAGVDVDPPASSVFRVGEFVLRFISLSEAVVEIVAECENSRFSGHVLMIAVDEGAHSKRYPIALYTEPSGLTVGCLLIRTFERSVIVRHLQLMRAEALKAEHIEMIGRALERLPPEAQSAWGRIARARPLGDPVRKAITDVFGDR